MTNPNITHAAALGALLSHHALTVGTAESCTGGLLMSAVTDIPGCSQYALGACVTYSNALKMRLVGVREATLHTWGAVSAQTAHEMAVGALDALDVALAMSVTGIAGPGGGTVEKPVGLVYIGVALRQSTGGQQVMVHEHLWQGDRQQNKEASVGAALQHAIALITQTYLPKETR